MSTADNFINRTNERVPNEPEKELLEVKLERLISEIAKYDEAIKDAEAHRQQKLDEAREAYYELRDFLQNRVANQLFDEDKPE